MPYKLLYEINEAKNGARHHFFLALVTALAMLASVAPRPCVAGEAKVVEQVFETVEPFYSWVLAHRFVYLPSDKERSELAGFLMPDLIQQMKTAKEMEGRCLEATKEGEKSLTFEGALLVGLYEGAMEVAYEEPKTSRHADGFVKLPVILTHINEHLPKADRDRAFSWNEELELRQKNGKWLINNIIFQRGRNLRSTLQDYINSALRDCIVGNIGGRKSRQEASSGPVTTRDSLAWPH